MKILISIAALYLCLGAHGQNSDADSLKKVLDTMPESLRRVVTLEGLSFAYVSSYPDTAMMYAQEGLKLARKIDNLQGQAYCTNALGNVYFSVGDYPTALEMYLQSLKMKEQLPNQEHAIAVTYFNIANVYTEQEDYRHALDYVLKAKQVDDKANDSIGIMFDLHSLSSIYLRMKMPDSAILYGTQAHQLAQYLQDKDLIGAILNNIAEIYLFLNNFPLAEMYYQLSIPYTEEANDNEVLASNYFGLAKALKEVGKADSSIYFGRKGLTVAQEGPFLKQLFENGSFLAEAFRTNKQFDSAFKYQELSIATKDSLYNVEKVKRVQNLKLAEQGRQQAIETATIEYWSKVRLYFIIAALAIFLLVAFWLWRSHKQKQIAYAQLRQHQSDNEHAQHQLKLAHARLLQSEKMASLGILSQGIIQEVGSPLVEINNLTEANKRLLSEMKEKIEKEDFKSITMFAKNVIENEEKINQHRKKVGAMFEVMSQYSANESDQKQLTDINALAEEYLHLSYQSVKARNRSFFDGQGGFKVILNTDFDNTLDKIPVSRQDFARVLFNLYSNAFYSLLAKAKSNPPGYEPSISVATRIRDEKIYLSVTDNGIGMSPEEKEKIFQPVFMMKNFANGSGMGLASTFDIITKEHSGEIKVESKPGQGTEFILYLPAK